MKNEVLSVHLQDFPKTEGKYDSDLVKKMDKVREICSVALFLRDKKNLRVRLPLNSVKIYGKEISGLSDLSDIIADEINVKKVEFFNNVDDIAELKLELDLKKLGSRLGQKLQDVLKANREGKWEKLDNGKVKIAEEILENDEFKIKLAPKNNSDSFGVLSTNDIIIELDLNLTEELEFEGLARDVVRFIQNSRKEADLNIADRIKISFKTTSEKLKNAINKNLDYIKEQTLTKEFNYLDTISGEKTFKGKVDDNEVEISIEIA